MDENTPSAGEETPEENREPHRGRKPRRRPHSKPRQGGEPSLNMAEIQEIAELVDRHGFTDFEFENENIRVRVSKTPPAQIVQAVQHAAPAAAPVAAPPPAPAKTEPKLETPHPGAKAEQDAAADEDLYKITSPIVGTFYRSPSPDKDPYVKVGANVTPDSIVCIVEAMKLMNEE